MKKWCGVIEKICATVCGLCVLYGIGISGSIETNSMDAKSGAVRILVCGVIAAASLALHHFFVERY